VVRDGPAPVRSGTAGTVRALMLRRPRLRHLALALLLATACGDDGAEPAAVTTTSTSAPVPATLPDDVEVGRGALVLDGHGVVLTVTACALEPVTDPATGVTTELTAAAEDGTGLTVDIVRSSFTAAVPSVTDTIRVIETDGTTIESSRVDRDGLQIDLRLPNPVGRLLEVDVEAGLLRAEGVFGPPEGTGEDPANVDGELLLRCP